MLSTVTIGNFISAQGQLLSQKGKIGTVLIDNKGTTVTGKLVSYQIEKS